MAEFTLSKNLKIQKGQRIYVSGGASNAKTFAVYRWSPDDKDGNGDTAITYRPVIMETLTDEIDPIPPKKRVY